MIRERYQIGAIVWQPTFPLETGPSSVWIPVPNEIVATPKKQNMAFAAIEHASCQNVVAGRVNVDPKFAEVRDGTELKLFDKIPDSSKSPGLNLEH